MASTKAGGSAKNLNTSNPKYLGIKLADGAEARPRHGHRPTARHED